MIKDASYFKQAAEDIEKVRTTLLFGNENVESPNDGEMSEEVANFYFLAVAALEQACNFLNLAALKQVRGVAELQLSGKLSR